LGSGNEVLGLARDSLLLNLSHDFWLWWYSIPYSEIICAEIVGLIKKIFKRPELFFHRPRQNLWFLRQRPRRPP
jgi:hypothetical protein